MGKANKPQDVFMHIDMRYGSIVECWEWKGKVNAKDGRPYFTVEGKRRPAYAIALEAYSGEEAKGRYVLHQCDNSICCNPHHLKWGDHQDNMNDMKDRDRHGVPKTVARAIKRLHESGKTQQEIADLYGLSREAVSAITTGRNKEET